MGRENVPTWRGAMQPSKVTLLPHQLEGLDAVKDSANCALYWDMGLGKTFGGSEQMLRYGMWTNLVVCQKSKVHDWVEHFKEYYPCHYEVFDLTAKGATKEFYRREYSGERMIVGVINYELAWRRPELLDISGFTLMLDESSLIQNRRAKQTKFILRLHPEHVILLSGTPTAGKYENLWTQAHLLGWAISEKTYNSTYVNWMDLYLGYVVRKVVDKRDPYKNVDRLKRKLREHGAVFMKTEDVYTLPEQTFTEVRVPVTKLYKHFIRTGYAELPDGTELIGDQVFSRRIYARQLCAQYSDAKLDAVRDLLASTNDRVIVFYNFNAELDALKRVCESLDRPISQVNGSTKDLTAYNEESSSVALIQYQAGAMGLNLQKANKIVYFSLPERSDLYEQSKARTHRIGQERPCFYWIMLCERSVEEAIYRALKERKDFTDELFMEVMTDGC